MADPTEHEAEERNLNFRKAGAELMRYVDDNPLASVAGALISGIMLARFFFLGNPKAD